MTAMRRRAFTLIELLLVIAILSLLLQLLLPAIQASRESARNMQCKNQLRQIEIAIEGHVGSHGHYPTGGWKFTWVGDNSRGYGVRQPGGWIFNVLPYTEYSAVYDMDVASQNSVALPMFYCPSRRPANLYPMVHDKLIQPMVNLPLVALVSKSDYAANAGWVNQQTSLGVNWEQGAKEIIPKSLEEGDSSDFGIWLDRSKQTGIVF